MALDDWVTIDAAVVTVTDELSMVCTVNACLLLALREWMVLLLRFCAACSSNGGISSTSCLIWCVSALNMLNSFTVPLRSVALRMRCTAGALAGRCNERCSPTGELDAVDAMNGECSAFTSPSSSSSCSFSSCMGRGEGVSSERSSSSCAMATSSAMGWLNGSCSMASVSARSTCCCPTSCLPPLLPLLASSRSLRSLC